MPITALDLVKRNNGALYPLVEEVAVVAPEFSTIPAETIDGTSIEVSVRTGLPTVAFRNANEGVTPTKSTFATRTYETFILDAPVAIDKALAKGEKATVNLMEDETVGVLGATLQTVGNQFYYGNPSASDKGFPGLIAQAANDAAHVVDATGTTAKTSVWLLARNRRDGVKFIMANGETLVMSDTWRTETQTDGSGKKYTALVNDLTGRVGMSLKNKDTAYRIKNIGTDTGKGLTDALLNSALRLAAEKGVVIDAIYMTPRSQEQLQNSRTTYSPTGAPAPVPTEKNGIPFIITNSISNAE